MGLYGKKYKLNDLTVRAFLALTAAGLWGRGGGGTADMESGKGYAVSDIPWEQVDWEAVLQLAREQALVGVMASAFDAGEGGTVAPGLGFELQEVMSRDQRKAFSKKVYSIEQRNVKVDDFLVRIARWFEDQGLHPVLLKGQGVARAYKLPLRRSPGDLDFLFRAEEYEKAKQLLSPKAGKVCNEGKYEKQLQMFFNKMIVELHGTMRVTLSKKIDSHLDGMMERMYEAEDFGSFSCGSAGGEGKAEVQIPSAQVHTVYVFCHILEHLFHSGIGLRQVCDLARMLHVHRDEIDREKLYSDITSLGLMDEWRAFAALIVNYLGMKPENVPFYAGTDSRGSDNNSVKWNRKAKKILSFILSTGNMGKNRDLSYRRKSPYLVKKTKTLWFIVSNAVRLGTIFPKDTALISLKGIGDGMKDLVVHD